MIWAEPQAWSTRRLATTSGYCMAFWLVAANDDDVALLVAGLTAAETTPPAAVLLNTGRLRMPSNEIVAERPLPNCAV